MKYLASNPEKAKTFLRAVAAGKNYKQSAIAAGVSNGPDFAEVLQDPAARAYLTEQLHIRLQGELAPYALKLVEELIKSSRTPIKERIKLAVWILERGANMAAPKAVEHEKPPTNPLEMSGDQLKAYIMSLEHERQRRADGAKLIDAEPVDQVPSLVAKNDSQQAQELDFLD